MDHHQIKITLPGNADVRHYTHSARAPLVAEQTYGVNKIFTEPVYGMTPAAGGGFETSTALHSPHFNTNKWISIVIDNGVSTAPVIQGHVIARSDIILFTNQTGNMHLNGFYIALTDYYRVSTGVWANSGTYTYAIGFQRLSEDMIPHPTSVLQYRSDQRVVLEDDVSSLLGGGATWATDEFGSDMFTFATNTPTIRRKLATETVYESVTISLNENFQILLTDQDESSRNGYYSNHLQPASKLREFRRFPKFEYGTGSTLYVYGNAIDSQGQRVSAEATEASHRSVIEFIPGNILYKDLSDDIMQKMTVNYTMTRIRGVDGRVTWKAPANGPQTLEYFGNTTHPNSLYKTSITYSAAEQLIDGSRGFTSSPVNLLLITGMPTPAADGVYLFKGVVDAASPYMKAQYERVDGYNSTHTSATGNASYLASSNSGQQYTVEVTHPDATKTYLQTSNDYVPGHRGGVAHLTKKPTLYAALTGTAPAMITGGHLDIGRQFTANAVSMTHTTFMAVFGKDVTHGSAYDRLVKRGLGVVLDGDVLPHHAHSSSGVGNEKNRTPHFHIHLEADKPFTSIERHNVHYKALRIPNDAEYRYVFEDTGEPLDEAAAAVIAKCTITLNFIGHLL